MQFVLPNNEWQKIINCSLLKNRILAYLWCPNSNADINVISVYDIIPINDSIDSGQVLKCTDSSLKQIGRKVMNETRAQKA